MGSGGFERVRSPKHAVELNIAHSNVYIRSSLSFLNCKSNHARWPAEEVLISFLVRLGANQVTPRALGAIKSRFRDFPVPGTSPACGIPDGKRAVAHGQVNVNSHAR